MIEYIPGIEYEASYPVDEDFSEVTALEPFLSFSLAAKWLLHELPKAADFMPCFCEVEEGVSDLRNKAVRHIHFSTGGWSGAESIIALIERRADLSYHMLSWKRGGHYVFEVPAA